jgi:hypothetical protein
MGCRAPQLPVGISPADSSNSQWSISLTEGYRNSDKLYSGTSSTGGGLETTILQTIGNVRWTPKNWLSMDITIPYYHEYRRVEVEEETVDLQGLGDIRLTAGFRPLAGKESFFKNFTLIAGLELPTGDDDNRVRNDDLGFALFEGLNTNSQFQLGSGTWDPIIGYQFSHAFNDRFSIFQDTTAQFSWGTSDKGYEPGDSVSAELGFRVQVAKPVTVSAGLEATFRDRDTLSGETILNTGGTLLSINASVAWRLSDHWALNAGARVPIWRDLNASRFSAASAEEFGTEVSSQLSPGPYVFGGMTFSF